MLSGKIIFCWVCRLKRTKRTAWANCLFFLLVLILLFSGSSLFVAGSGSIRGSNPDLALPVIYIRSDGSVEGTNMIERNNDTYTFKGDIGAVNWNDYNAYRENVFWSQGIVVECDNIIIDGAGYALTGPGHFNVYYFVDGKLTSPPVLNNVINGICLNEKSNVTVKNLKAQLFWTPIDIHKCINITLLSNNLTENFDCGIEVRNSSQVNVTSNEIRGSADGVDIQDSSDCVVYNNSFIGNTNGVLLASEYEEYFSNDNVIVNNEFVNNQNAIRIGSARNSIVSSNNMTLNGDGIVVTGWSDNVISNNFISNNDIAIDIVGLGASGNIFCGNLIINNTASVSVYEGLNNTFCSNNFVNNTKEVISRYEYWRVEENFTSSINFWDNGKAGNYWSSYSGSDRNGDGLGDTPYSFYPVSARRVTVYCGQDNHPLMSPAEASGGYDALPVWAREKLVSLSLIEEASAKPQQDTLPASNVAAIAAVSAASAIAVCAGLVVYFKKRKR
jgi:parallel beta-helix repeat protein